jgi:hypothetical protein
MENDLEVYKSRNEEANKIVEYLKKTGEDNIDDLITKLKDSSNLLFS